MYGGPPQGDAFAGGGGPYMDQSAGMGGMGVMGGMDQSAGMGGMGGMGGMDPSAGSAMMPMMGGCGGQAAPMMMAPDGMWMNPGGAPQGVPQSWEDEMEEDPEIQRMERQLERMKQKTHVYQAMNGTPIHGQMSKVSMFMTAFTVVVTIVLGFMPNWYYNYWGIMFGPGPRYFGIIYNSGKLHQHWPNKYTVTLETLASLHVGAICMTPLCDFYRDKTHAYMTMSFMTMVAALVYMLFAILGPLQFYCILKLTPKKLRCASFTSVIMLVLNISTVVLFFIAIEMFTFDPLRIHSYIPQMTIGLCVWLMIPVFVMQITVVVLNFTLMFQWPEPDSDTEMSDDEDDDDDD